MTALNFPASPSNGDVYENYQYDGTDGVWKRLPSSSLGINGLADVTITTPADGESLVYDNATGEWINADATVEVYGVDTAETSYFSLPKGTDEQRPVSPSNGDIRFNTDSGSPEWYSADNNEWILFRSAPSFSVEYLVLAGGGGGGPVGGGGGGAGGYRCNVTGENSGGGASAEAAFSATPGTYTVTVGAGGAGAANNTSRGSNGSNSVFATLISDSGGGGSYKSGPAGLDGGSGGGGSESGNVGGAGTTNQGFDGGTGNTAAGAAGGGGGGASAVGANAPNNSNGANGGAGVSSSITGSAVTRAGGAGGGAQQGTGGTGGAGGGGNGGSGGSNGTAGTANTGGGGGGNGTTQTGLAGGSGVVIIKYPAAYTATPTVGLTSSTSTVGDFKVTTFTAGTGTVTFS